MTLQPTGICFCSLWAYLHHLENFCKLRTFNTVVPSASLVCCRRVAFGLTWVHHFLGFGLFYRFIKLRVTWKHRFYRFIRFGVAWHCFDTNLYQSIKSCVPNNLQIYQSIKLRVYGSICFYRLIRFCVCSLRNPIPWINDPLLRWC